MNEISVTPTPAESRRMTGTTKSPRTAKREDQPPREWPVWALKMREGYEARIAQLEREKSELEAAIIAARRAQREMNDTALTLYGGSSALKEVTKQVSISPKFASLNAQEHEYVGRIALATGLNPEFHIHAWTAEVYDREVKAKVRKLFVMPDYKALIQLSKRDYLMLKERRLTADEMRERGIPERDIEEGAIAYLVEGYELDKAILAKQAGLDYEPLRGFGWWAAKKDDVAWNGAERKMLPTGKRIDNDVPQGRDGAWVAWKRAIRALYNQIADLTLKFNRPADMPADEDGDTWTFEAPAVPMVIEGEIAGGAHQAPDPDLEPPALPDAEPEPAPTPAPPGNGHEPAPTANLTWTRDTARIAKMLDAAEQMWRIPRPLAIDRVAKALGLDNPQGKYETLFACIATYGGSPQDAWNAICAHQSDKDAPTCYWCDERPATGDGPYPELCATCARSKADDEAAKSK